MFVVTTTDGIFTFRFVVIEVERQVAEATPHIEIMCAKLFSELQAGVALYACLLGKHRPCGTLYATDTFNQERRNAILGTIITLRDTVERIAEHLHQFEVRIKLECGSNQRIEIGGLYTVLVDSITIFQQCGGVSQRQVAVNARQEVVCSIERR